MTTGLTGARKAATPIETVGRDQYEMWLAGQSDRAQQWLEQVGFRPEPGRWAFVPDAKGAVGSVVVGRGAEAEGLWTLAALPMALPEGVYRLAETSEAAQSMVLGWSLGAYAFTRYKDPKRRPAELQWPDRIDRAAVERTEAATRLVRDLVNTPADDMGPADLAQAARTLAKDKGAKYAEVVGEALLKKNFPAIHAVGRAAAEAPRLIDLTWGEADAPKVTLVGKGVCFDSGGLDLKPASAMKLMKKDMGGAAHVLGLASMIMDAELPVRLRVLIPAVENAVSGNALRPMDVVTTRHGTTVEIGHTDAEGRVVLSDALAEASSEMPELIVDFATLTGAARVALGPELPAMFANVDALADAIAAHAKAETDPVWRLPLWAPYRPMIEGKTADITNSAESPFAGAITAALFLQTFVGDDIDWVHFDVMAWNPSARPGRPEGGEAMAMRAVYAMIAERFGA